MSKLSKWTEINGPKNFCNWQESWILPIKLYHFECVYFARHHGIYKYDVTDDEKSQFFAYPKSFENPNAAATIVYHPYGHYIYLVAFFGIDICAKFNVKTNKFKLYTKLSPIFQHSYGLASMILQDELHFIGGLEWNNHYIWNENSNKTTTIPSFDDKMSGRYVNHRIVFIPSRNLIWSLGGEISMNNNDNNEVTDAIYSYKNEKWKKLTIKLPEASSSFGVITVDDRFIILFNSDIFVLDLDHQPNYQQFREIEIKCPVWCGYGYHVVLISKCSVSDKKLVSVFINYNAVKLHLIIPMDIIDLVLMWYCTEYVLLQTFPLKLWEIPLNDILRIK